MKRTSYQIDDRTALGVQFTTAKGFYFWDGERDRLHRWNGRGWDLIPIDQLGAKRRAALANTWGAAA
jgi:hypothetical protein